MARVYTYSFEDTSLTISHPGFGTYTAYGTGIGDITISYENNVTYHNVASDLAVVVSKWVARNGNVQMNILQSSDFNEWLKKFAAFLEEAPTDQFALATMDIKNKSTGDSYHCTGVSHQKRADNSFQSQAQNRTWTMMCANISG
nr:MAG TPA: Protein of unknown function (DUF3277) [Caudoviricetes sp.]